MTFTLALAHLLGFVSVPLGVALITTLLAKLVWRAKLRAPLATLLVWSAGAALAVWVVAIVVNGREGEMLAYGAMLLAISLALWWKGLRGA